MKIIKNIQYIIFVSLIISLFVIFHQNNINKKLNDEILFNKNEIERYEYNRIVDSSTIKTYVDESGNLHAQQKAYKLTIDELNKNYDSIFNLYLVQKGKKPEIITKWKTKIVDSIIYIPTSVTDKRILLNDSVNYGNGNYRILNGEIPYIILRYSKYDSLYHAYDSLLSYPTLFTENGKFDLEQSINLQLSFYEDNKELLFDVTTDYPGIKFNGLVGAKISDYDEFKTSVPNPWRIGIHAGYGFYIKDNISSAPYVGIGVMYTPHFLLKKKK